MVTSFLNGAFKANVLLSHFSAILFPINFPVASAALETNFLEAVFAASNSVFVAVSNIFPSYLSDRFLANDICPYPWAHCFVPNCKVGVK